MALDVEPNGHANACAFWRELPMQDADHVREPRNAKLEKLFAAFEAMAARAAQPATGG
jgi:peptide/nickel transport system ATP-binding protein/oligopeptide transport system ATP-binding protein